MKTRVLIVDDLEMKAKVLESFIELHCLPCEIISVDKFSKAAALIDQKFDLGLFDHFLDDGHLGITLLKAFEKEWPNLLGFLYSSDPQAARETIIDGTKCFSFDAIMTEILIAHGDFSKPVKEVQPMEAVKGDVYNKALCNQIHAEIERRDVKLESAMMSIADNLTSFKLSTEKSNIKVLGVVVGILLSLVANFVLFAIKSLG